MPRDAMRFAEINATAAFVRERLGVPEGENVASVGVVLGSGLGRVADRLAEGEGGKALDYAAIPHFPVSSVEGHKGRLVFGVHRGVPALLMQGRVHRYEGWSAFEVTFPVRVLLALGVKRLLLTNAAGGIAEGMQPGDLMLITDHLNLTGDNPLVGRNDDRLGPRFPDMSEAYSARLRQLARKIAERNGVRLVEGVYAGMLGPSYETPAEVRMLRGLGAHAVGMSTVYEAIAAVHGGAEVLGISCITNLAAGISEHKLSHEEVKETAARVEEVFSTLVLDLLPELSRAPERAPA